MYDPNNVFAQILRRELPSKVIFEDDHVYSFHDLYPKAPVHVLVISKKPYIHFSDFASNADSSEISHFFKTIEKIAQSLGLKSYKLICHNGASAGQEVPHFHMHILGSDVH